MKHLLLYILYIDTASHPKTAAHCYSFYYSFWIHWGLIFAYLASFLQGTLPSAVKSYSDFDNFRLFFWNPALQAKNKFPYCDIVWQESSLCGFNCYLSLPALWSAALLSSDCWPWASTVPCFWTAGVLSLFLPPPASPSALSGSPRWPLPLPLPPALPQQ